MTAILTFVFADSVIQASDRRVTVRNDAGLSVHDPAANKSVIYLARDCRLVIGYTGPAYIDELPTDAWLAKQLSGESVIGHLCITHPPAPLLNVDKVLDLFTKRLPPRLTISIGGFERTNAGQEPVLKMVTRGSVSELYEPGSSRDYAYGVMIPATWAAPATMDALLEDISASSALEQHMALVRGIRRLAESHPEVGSDVLIVELAEEKRWVGSSLYAADTTEDRSSLAYSPAILLANMVMAPMKISEGQFQAVLQPGGICWGPVEDPESDCIIAFNVDKPPGAAGFHEGERKLPPTLW